MVSLEGFEATLKEVVQGKRLSLSKMNKLTEIALKTMENDTQLVSILYRTHKSLGPNQKVSSLYVFDALVRAARSQVVKHSITTPSEAGKGNAATFLSKIEGVVEGLFEDMIATHNPEAKEKTRKILDIWVKSSALPSGVLKRLGDLIKDTRAEKEPSENIIPNVPRNHSASVTPPTPSTIATPPPATTPTTIPEATTPLPAISQTPVSANPLQSTLLALLSQAANAIPNGNNLQTGTNTTAAENGSVNTAGLDVNQLALFQQLAQTVKTGSLPGSIPGINPAMSHAPQSSMMGMGGGTVAGPSDSHPPHSPPYHGGASEFGYGGGPRHGGGRRGFHGEEYYDDRRDRGGFGRGRGRGGGRWGEGESRWDHRPPRERRGDWESKSPQAPGLPPPLMSRGRPDRDRSRSPPQRNRFVSSGGPGMRRDPRPYSPPEISASSMNKTNDGSPVDEPRGLKDEFGRDIRSTSADETSGPPIVPNQSSVGTPRSQPTPSGGAPIPTYQEPTRGSNSEAANSSQIQSAAMPIATYVSRDVSGSGGSSGLHNFDLTTFEFTSPASWEALGKAWQITNGYFPSQEQLFEFVMMSTGVGPMSGIAVGETNTGDSEDGQSGTVSNWQTQSNAGSLARGGNWNQGGSRTAAYGTDIDAWDVSARTTDVVEEESKTDDPVFADNAVGSSGKMQKVGDKWVFVRS